MLKPIRSTQADLTGEWYISKSSSLTGAIFYKTERERFNERIDEWRLRLGEWE